MVRRAPYLDRHLLNALAEIFSPAEPYDTRVEF
jgi:hypothetical protein